MKRISVKNPFPTGRKARLLTACLVFLSAFLLFLPASKAEDSANGDRLTTPSAANAAALLRAGETDPALDYWDTAQAFASTEYRLKKATVAMLRNTLGLGPAPAGREGIHFQASLENPLIAEGEELQKRLDFNIRGSIYTGSPLTSVTASFESLGTAKGCTQTVTFDPAANVRAYSLENETLPVEQKALDSLFDISGLSAGRYRFTLSATTSAETSPVKLYSAECTIVDSKRLVLTQNKFDDNYLEAYRFFRGKLDQFIFHFSLKDTRSIATEDAWRTTYIVESSLGRVHSSAVPYFETANHYLENTYVCVTLVNPKNGKQTDGRLTLLKDLISKETTYVPRFQSNLQYVSHHTLGTAIDVNDDMYPNKNIITNHELIGTDVKQNLVYNGIKTADDGRQYYDFTYNGSYPGKFERIPKTIINYLLYELAFYRAGFQWGYYYETACDAMHFTLSENDINRHMHSDIGLREIYDYIEPEWTYVPGASPSPEAVKSKHTTAEPEITPTPDVSRTPETDATPEG
ncbi:MAG: M15 family metallopeptidase [Eubacteriales bacterium]|nr:M15 family metallopeptidase [Eubacteriales bacterium]